MLNKKALLRFAARSTNSASTAAPYHAVGDDCVIGDDTAMCSGSEKKNQTTPVLRSPFRRRDLFRIGTLITAFTGTSAISALGATTAHAAAEGRTLEAKYVPVAEKGTASGVATLDVGCKVPFDQIPDLSVLYGADAPQMKANFGGAVRISKYGTGSAAFESAAAEAGIGGTIFLPKAGGPYTITTPVTLADVNIDSDGATIVVPASFSAGPEAAAITLDSPQGHYSGMHAKNFRLIGPGTRTLGVRTANVVGIRINRRCKPVFDHVEVRYFDKGFAFNNELGHISLINGTNANNNYYGVYLERNNNDYLFHNCEINGNTFANFGCPADQGWGALIVKNAHIGYAPYSFYQEAEPKAQGINKGFISTALFSHARFEAIGNAAIWSDATVDAGNFSLAETIDIDNPGFSWAKADGSYDIAARPRTHAIYFPQTNRQIRIRNGNYPFVAADPQYSPIRIKRPGHTVLEIIGNGAAATNVTSDTGRVGALYAYEYPANGLITHNGNTADPVLSFGTSTGFIQPGGSSLRRLGTDTAYLYADFNNDFRFRNSASGNTLIGRITANGISMPKYYIGAAGSMNGPTWTTGAGAPSASEPNGSIYVRTDGGAATSLYVRISGAWVSK